MGNAIDKKGNIDPKYLLPQGQFNKYAIFVHLDAFSASSHSFHLFWAMVNELFRTAWDPKVLKKSVIERKLAPFFSGAEEKTNAEMEECPICFLV